MDYETLIVLSLRDLGYDDINHPLTERDIKVRHRELAMKFHPDKQIFNDDSWMKKINSAKDFLINNLDKVNAFIYKNNPSLLREEVMRAEAAKEAQKKAEEERKAKEEKERKEREAAERKRREAEALKRAEEERKARERRMAAEAKRREEERKKKAEEKRKFEEWYNSLSPKEKKKYDNEQIKKAKQEKKRLYLAKHPNHYKVIGGISCIVGFIVVLTVVLVCYFNVYLKSYYDKGMKLYEEQVYAEAMTQFQKAKGYKDAKDYNKRANAEVLIAEGKTDEAGLLLGSIYNKEDYIKSKELLWKDYVIHQTIAMSSDFIVGIEQNGSLIGKELNHKNHSYSEYETWEGITYVAMTEETIIGLKEDGTLLVEGSSKLKKRVKKWKNIVQIYTAGEIIFGLRADGKIVHTSKSSNRTLKEITQWEKVVNFDIHEFVYSPYDRDDDICYYYAVAALVDGTAKYSDDENAYTETIGAWEDIKQVSLSYGEYIGVHIVGLKKDKTVVACGTNHNNVCNVESWKNIIQVHTMATYTFGLKSDGTIILTGSDAFSKKDVSNIKSAAYMPKIGNLMVVDKNGNLQCENGKTLAMAEWKNIQVPNCIFSK